MYASQIVDLLIEFVSVLIIFIQFVILVALLVFGIHVQISMSRQQRKGWIEIMDGIAQLKSDLETLSYGSIFSEGLECPIDDVWRTIGGWRGLRAIFVNTGVILAALDYIERNASTNVGIARTLEGLRSRAKRVRILAMMSYIRYLAALSVGEHSIPVEETATEYIALIAHTSLAVNDYRPDLLRHFKYAVLRR